MDREKPDHNIIGAVLAVAGSAVVAPVVIAGAVTSTVVNKALDATGNLAQIGYEALAEAGQIASGAINAMKDEWHRTAPEHPKTWADRLDSAVDSGKDALDWVDKTLGRVAKGLDWRR